MTRATRGSGRSCAAAPAARSSSANAAAATQGVPPCRRPCQMPRAERALARLQAKSRTNGRSQENADGLSWTLARPPANHEDSRATAEEQERCRPGNRTHCGGCQLQAGVKTRPSAEAENVLIVGYGVERCHGAAKGEVAPEGG